MRKTIQLPRGKVSAKDIASAEQEVRLLAELDHKHIVEFMGYERTRDAMMIYMEFCAGGDLSGVIKRARKDQAPLEEPTIREYFGQISRALAEMHGRNILHRDLKAQNIFLTADGCIKLGDFGIARRLRSADDLAETVIGTPFYMSPELFARKPYSFKSDIWSLGCVLFELASLDHVFTANDMAALRAKVLSGTPPPIPRMYSRELRALVSRMLQKDPASRPSLDQVLASSFLNPAPAPTTTPVVVPPPVPSPVEPRRPTGYVNMVRLRREDNELASAIARERREQARIEASLALLRARKVAAKDRRGLARVRNPPIKAVHPPAASSAPRKAGAARRPRVSKRLFSARKNGVDPKNRSKNRSKNRPKNRSKNRSKVKDGLKDRSKPKTGPKNHSKNTSKRRSRPTAAGAGAMKETRASRPPTRTPRAPVRVGPQRQRSPSPLSPPSGGEQAEEFVVRECSFVEEDAGDEDGVEVDDVEVSVSDVQAEIAAEKARLMASGARLAALEEEAAEMSSFIQAAARTLESTGSFSGSGSGGVGASGAGSPWAAFPKVAGRLSERIRALHGELAGMIGAKRAGWIARALKTMTCEDVASLELDAPTDKWGVLAALVSGAPSVDISRAALDILKQIAFIRMFAS